MSLGSQIARFRKEKNMTQESLANTLGVTNQAVSKWELDQSCPDVLLLPKLADVFGITMDCLFERERSTVAVDEPVSVQGLPWADDGELRAVFYIGHTLRKHQRFTGLLSPKQVEFTYDGPALNVRSDFAVVCKRDVGGSVHAGDSVTCGSVGGDVKAGDGVRCGDVYGSVSAGDSVNCGNVGGNVSAGDNVNCKNVGGNVRASGRVSCDRIGGDRGGNG